MFLVMPQISVMSCSTAADIVGGGRVDNKAAMLDGGGKIDIVNPDPCFK
jgi:hypothetical protein